MRAEKSPKSLALMLLAVVNVLVCMWLLTYSIGRVLAFTDDIELTCDLPLTETIEDKNETDFLNFSAVDGERIEFTIVRGIRFGSNFQPSWRLVKKDGAPANTCGSFTTDFRGECGPLSASDSPYRIEVRDQDQDDTGTYRVHFYRLSAVTACENTPLTCGALMQGSIDSALDSDLFSFIVPNNERISVLVVNREGGPNFRPAWRLLRGDGTPANACGSFTTNSAGSCGELPANGNPYRIEVQDSDRDDTGLYVLTVNFLDSGCPPSPAIALTPGQLNVVAGTSADLTVTLNQTRNNPTTITLTSSNNSIAT
ncbi:MAG: hypothetical protein MOB07_15730, partial [Acidobacteria bacterium]|nr:hypothetical protein [Acidobacteriota bacterium]